jgi:hypothetical protein
MINAAKPKTNITFGFRKLTCASVVLSLFSLAASAQTYPVSGVWVEKDDRFPGSTKGACFILKKLGIDGVSSQPFPNLMIFSENKRVEIKGDHSVEKTIRSVHIAPDGRFQITESLFKRRPRLFKRPFVTLQVVDATTIEITESNVSTRFFKCSPSPQL